MKMDNLAYNLPITELIANLDAYMVQNGYAPSTMRRFRQAWNALKNLSLQEGSIYFTKELGYKLLREHYHIEPYDLNMSDFKKHTRRAVMLLLEYQISGTIAKPNLRFDHSFPENYAEIGKSYLSHLKNDCHLRDSTIRNHSIRILKAFQFFESHGINSVAEVSEDCITSYIMTFAGLTREYIRGVVQTIKAFFDFAFSEGITTTQFSFPFISTYKDRKIPEYYTGEEIRSILNAVDRANPLGKRNYAMILLAARCGFRISDIINLKLNNIDFTQNTISIIQTKTSKPLVLDLLPDVGWAIIDYLKYGRPDIDSNYVFLRHTIPYREFSSGENLEYVIRRYANSAGITKDSGKKNSSFHMLRYGLASDLLQKNVSLTTISGVLGHSELNVTTKYTKLDTRNLKDCALEVPYDSF